MKKKIVKKNMKNVRGGQRTLATSTASNQGTLKAERFFADRVMIEIIVPGK